MGLCKTTVNKIRHNNMRCVKNHIPEMIDTRITWKWYKLNVYQLKHVLHNILNDRILLLSHQYLMNHIFVPHVGWSSFQLHRYQWGGQTGGLQMGWVFNESLNHLQPNYYNPHPTQSFEIKPYPPINPIIYFKHLKWLEHPCTWKWPKCSCTPKWGN